MGTNAQAESKVLKRCIRHPASSPAAPSGCALAVTNALVAVVADGPYPVRWGGRQAVVALPEHIDASNSGLIREQLLDLINRGAAVLIADMTGTVSCDHGGADALLGAYRRAALSGGRLRVAATVPVVRRVLEASGLDRLVPVYPSVETAMAAGMSGVIPLAPRPGNGEGGAMVRPRRRGQAARVTPAVLWALIDALHDGVILTDDDGVIVLANRRAGDMYGYLPGELIGEPVESLVPDGLRAAHVSQRAGYARHPTARPMAARARLAGRRKDGSTFPVRVSLSPVPTATGRLILAVTRDVTDDLPHADLGDLARAVAAAGQALRARELLDRVVNGLLQIGLSLQAAVELPHEAAVQQIADALHRLDDTIGEIRDHVFSSRNHDEPPQSGPPNGSG
jgi:anti-anti-sigma factor